MTGPDDSDTGHVWDRNLRELTNQPPRWWMITLYLSGLFMLVYFVLYPAIPLPDGATKGVLGWTQMKRLSDSVQDIEEVRAPYEKRIEGMAAADILADEELSGYVVASAKVLFGDRCAPCHGAGGAGIPGYPVLADDDWLYGGSIELIEQSIAQGRRGNMPAYSAMLSEQELDRLAAYMLALSGGTEDVEGKALFDAKGCPGCHGSDARGMPMLGAANLTDSIWRFSPGNEQGIRQTIAHGVNVPGSSETRKAVMPAFGPQLSAAEISKLAVYVHRLGGGLRAGR